MLGQPAEWGKSWLVACDRAGEYVQDCIAYTAAQQTNLMHGVQFEKLLYHLVGGCDEA